jgi:hypothetical protein
MMCEVVVMNQRGIALAADSAVTLGAGRKIYQSAEKLFPLSSSSSVAIMTYGNADFMGMPWEIIIKAYANKLGGGKFDKLEQYARDFLAFIEASDSAGLDRLRGWPSAYYLERPDASLRAGPLRLKVQRIRSLDDTVAHGRNYLRR